ncbi:MAG: RluA family pseudouridine synthase [Oscillospiraceae bacterium]|jgi:23S rRNA pseudouridine1911/1915/1917 synthase|nr:RluA family pseudouridine synthase [Oscillospiraceae bacterium]
MDIAFPVTEADDGRKLYQFLRGKGVSVSLLRTLKATAGGITRRGETVRTIDKVCSGDTIQLTLPEEGISAEPIPMPLDVLYEDESLLVLNKPANLAMHPTHNHQGDTLANGAAAYLRGKGECCPFRAVGRLDKGTSGVVLIAKDPYTAAALSGKVQKTYYALAQGVMEGSGTYREAIYRPNPNCTLRWCTCTPDLTPGAESAVTHWEALRTDGSCTFLRLRLETGRTHQIRVHFAYHGHPLVGDTYYGADAHPAGHQLLHCREAAFRHPLSDVSLTVRAPLPQEYQAFADILYCREDKM